MDLSHINSQGERISIRKMSASHKFAGQYVLVIHDDPPPHGSGVEAPMLLDADTAAWLHEHTKKIVAAEEK
ncbi:MAG: hypothetical protein AAGF31_13565 [Planctomycetota bacterium]